MATEDGVITSTSKIPYSEGSVGNYFRFLETYKKNNQQEQQRIDLEKDIKKAVEEMTANNSLKETRLSADSFIKREGNDLVVYVERERIGMEN